MKNRLLLWAAAFFACSYPAASLGAAAGSQTSHPLAAAPKTKTQLSVAAAHVKAPVAPIRVAPADEYFGHQKLSILGINNTIHDTNLHIGFDRVHAAKYYGQLAPAADSLFDWAHKYPQDTWLPGRAYYMSHVFWQMHTSDGDVAANKCRALLFKQFPKSRWATLAKKETRDSVAPMTPEEIAGQAAATGGATGPGASTTSGVAQPGTANALAPAAAQAPGASAKQKQ